MVMKLDRVFLLSLVVVFLYSCAGTVTKDSDSAAEVSIQIQPTKKYLPVRQYDKNGLIVPFVASENPYLELKKIDRQAVLYFIEVQKAFKSEKFDAANTLLDKVIAEDEKLAGPWVYKGMIAIEQGDRKLAQAHFKHAIKLYPKNVNAYLPLAKLQRLDGQYIEAQNTYADALTVWRDFPEAHLNLGILYDIYLNDPLQAQQHMEAYQFLKGGGDAEVSRWLEEIRSRTGIEPNLYIGPSNASQNDKTVSDIPQS